MRGALLAEARDLSIDIQGLSLSEGEVESVAMKSIEQRAEGGEQ